jgi:hypothetical protein
VAQKLNTRYKERSVHDELNRVIELSPERTVIRAESCWAPSPSGADEKFRLFYDLDLTFQQVLEKYGQIWQGSQPGGGGGGGLNKALLDCIGGENPEDGKNEEDGQEEDLVSELMQVLEKERDWVRAEQRADQRRQEGGRQRQEEELRVAREHAEKPLLLVATAREEADVFRGELQLQRQEEELQQQMRLVRQQQMERQEEALQRQEEALQRQEGGLIKC